MFDVVTVFAREGVLIKMMYVDNLVFMCETIYGFRNKFCECDEVYENNGMKVNLMDTGIMLSGGTTKNRLSVSKLYLW